MEKITSSFNEIEDVFEVMPLPPYDRQIIEHNNLTLKEHVDEVYYCQTIKDASDNKILRRYDYKLWWFRQVKCYDKDKYEECKDEDGLPISKTEYVKINKVIGTAYEELTKGNWLNMLLSLPRNKSNVNIDNWKKCIKEGVDTTWGNKLSPIEYYKIVDTDEYYICEGNHRTCHAKFIGLTSIPAAVHYMRIKKQNP